MAVDYLESSLAYLDHYVQVNGDFSVYAIRVQGVTRISAIYCRHCMMFLQEYWKIHVHGPLVV